MALQLELWKEKRKELNLKYEDLAQKAQVSLNTVKNIFRGATTDPRLETVQAIEKTLGITRDSSQPPPKTGQISTSSSTSDISLTEKEKRLLRAFSVLVDEMQDYIIESTETLAAKQRELRGENATGKTVRRA